MQYIRTFIESLGAYVIDLVTYVGGLSILLGAAARSVFAGLFLKRYRIDYGQLAVQMVRVGVRSIGIVCLVQGFIGVILALQMEPPLADFQQQGQISSIIGIAGFRMLGPILTAVILSGFAGASIAAELGTMVVSEEIEAMNAMALDPVRFLVVPRLLATFFMMLLLTPVADLMIALGGYGVSYVALGADVYGQYWERMQSILRYRDFFTGLVQSGVFGILIATIACHEGLRVRGGAEGVGRATTATVVKCIVAIIIAACFFTVLFYVWGK